MRATDRLQAGILHPAVGARCLHCSQAAGACRCAGPGTDRRRPDVEGAPAFEPWALAALTSRARAAF